MRGKALYPTVSKIKLGITPAYAGKSNSSGTRLNMN